MNTLLKSLIRSKSGLRVILLSHILAFSLSLGAQDCSAFSELLPVYTLCPSADSIILNAGEQFDAYQWSTGETTQTIVVFEREQYEVTGFVFDDGDDIVICEFTTRTQVITDIIPPSITCPESISVPVDSGACSAIVAIPLPLATDNCLTPEYNNNYTNSEDASAEYFIGTTTVTYETEVNSVDFLGDNCTFTVTVIDDQPPVITCPQDIIEFASLAICGADITIATLEIGDNCSDELERSDNLNRDGDPSGFFPIGTTLVTATVTEFDTELGLSGACSFNVTVVDDLPPDTGNCPGAQTVEAQGGECNATAEFSVPTFTDNCGVSSVTSNLVPGDELVLGQNEVRYVARDGSGNEGRCTFVISVTPDDVATRINGPSTVCPGSPVTLSASSGEAYSWSTGATTPTILVDTPGDYSVTVFSEAGCTGSASQTVTAVCDDFNLDFRVMRDTACAGYVATFEDLSTGDLSFRMWDFGNGNTSAGRTPTTIYPDVGTYTVRLTVGNGATTRTDSTTIEIYPAVDVDFTVDLADGCDRRVANFTAITSSTFPLSYRWNFGDGSTSSAVNPRHSFVTFDTANVDLAVVDAFGCKDTVSRDLIIEDNGATPPTRLVDTFLCTGQSIRIGDTLFNADRPEGEVTLTASTGCDSLVRVHLRFPPEGNELRLADAGDDQALCNGSSIAELRGNLPPGLAGTWIALDGGDIVDAGSRFTRVVALPEGNSRFVWELSTVPCGVFARDTVSILRSANLTALANAGHDQGFCNVAETITLAARGNLPPGVSGRWEQATAQAASGVSVTAPNSPTSRLEGLEEDTVYDFYWILSTEDCGDFDRDTVRLSLSDDALAPARISGMEVSCGGEPIRLSGNLPPGTTAGIFETAGPGTPPFLLMIAEDTVIVEDLATAQNVIVWTLSAENCPEYSSDTIRIATTGKVAAAADIIFKPEADEITFNLLANDTIENLNESTFRLLNRPAFGQLFPGNQLGLFRYEFDPDSTRTVSASYEICVRGCPESCSVASVSFVRQPELKRPANVLTPNGDEFGETFIVPNAEDYPGGVALVIFDRWGDKLFESGNYRNDWAGTRNGKELPVGTYYYLIRAGVREEFELTGSVTIVR